MEVWETRGSAKARNANAGAKSQEGDANPQKSSLGGRGLEDGGRRREGKAMRPRRRLKNRSFAAGVTASEKDSATDAVTNSVFSGQPRLAFTGGLASSARQLWTKLFSSSLPRPPLFLTGDGTPFFVVELAKQFG